MEERFTDWSALYFLDRFSEISSSFSSLRTASETSIFLFIIIPLPLPLSGHLWEWARALPASIFPPSGVAGIVRVWGGQRSGHRACPPLSPLACSQVTFELRLSCDPPRTTMPFLLKLRRTRRYNVLSKNYFVTRIRLLDSNVIECTLSVESTGQECLEAVAQRLELREVKRYLSLCNSFLEMLMDDVM